MKRNTAINRLRALEGEIRAHGAKSLYLFGSVSRDEAGRNSDIDLFIDYDKRSTFNLIDVMTIKYLIEDRFKRKIDVMTRDSIHRLIRKRVVSEAIRVF